jgi:hypothetical protein
VDKSNAEGHDGPVGIDSQSRGMLRQREVEKALPAAGMAGQTAISSLRGERTEPKDAKEQLEPDEERGADDECVLARDVDRETAVTSQKSVLAVRHYTHIDPLSTRVMIERARGNWSATSLGGDS